MLPTSLLALSASFIVPIIAASTPSCNSSSDSTGYASQKLPYIYNDFCDELSTANFGTKQKLYDSPVIALSFSVAAAGECTLANCLTSFQTLVDGCDKNDKSIWGTGSLDSSCGTFSFSVWSPTATASLGTPDATITVATMKTYDIASLTASTSTSSSSSSSSSTSSPSSYSASTTSTTSEAQLPTAYVASTHLFANTTSSTASSNSSTSYISATLVSSAAVVTGSQIATTTKPDVGSTALGTSGADIIRVSGLSLVVVAGVFGVFL